MTSNRSEAINILTPTEIKRLQLRQEREQIMRILEGTVTASTRALLEGAVESIDTELRGLQTREQDDA